MARESTKGTKELISLFINKETIKALRDKAIKESRTFSAQAELLLNLGLKER